MLGHAKLRNAIKIRTAASKSTGAHKRILCLPLGLAPPCACGTLEPTHFIANDWQFCMQLSTFKSFRSRNLQQKPKL
jgi:hypothetical protein